MCEYFLFIVENTALWTNSIIIHLPITAYLVGFYFLIVVDTTTINRRFSVLWSLSLEGELLGHVVTMYLRTYQFVPKVAAPF